MWGKESLVWLEDSYRRSEEEAINVSDKEGLLGVEVLEG